MPVPEMGRPAVKITATLVGDDVRRGLRAFGLSAEAGQSVEIFFCESSPSYGLALLNAGIILRLRYHPHGVDDATVMLRPCRPDQLRGRWSGSWRIGAHTFRIEGGPAGGREVLAASLVRTVPGEQIRRARRARIVGDVFSRQQKQFLADCGPVPVSFDRLTVLGPVRARRWSFDDAGFAVAAERWTVDALDILELSLLVNPHDAPFIQLAFLAFVRRCGLDPDATQQTRTQAVLDYLSRRLPPLSRG
jgi:hypothetical protein